MEKEYTKELLKGKKAKDISIHQFVIGSRKN